MRPTTVVRLALAGTRTDTLRIALTAASAAMATLAVLAALTVLAIPTPPTVGDDRNSNHATQYASNLLAEPGLRPGVVITLVLLTIPVLALAGQSSRLGAPDRDRRLAAIRLAGATPRQAVAVVAGETGLASLLGTVVGLGVYLAARNLLHRPDAAGQLPLPTDVLPAPAAIAIVVLGLPLLAALVGVVLLRRVVITPFGVVRRVRRERAPWPWPGLLIVAGVLIVTSGHTILRWLEQAGITHREVGLLVGLAGVVLAAVGVVLGTGWLSYTAGRLLHRFGRGPAALLAARRLMADPWTGSRTFAALLVAVLVGGAVAGVRAYFVLHAEVNRAQERLLAQAMAEDPIGYTGNDDFYLDTMALVNLAVVVALVIATGGLLVSLVEGVVARRRTYAALVASGVPHRVIGRAIAWQVFAPVVPATALALTVGVLLVSGVFGEVTAGTTGASWCDASPEVCADPVASVPYLRVIELPQTAHPVPVPFLELARYGLGALLAVLLTVGVGTLFLRRGTALGELRVG